MSKPRYSEQQLAFTWHAVETAAIGLGLVWALIGFIWSWKHLTATNVEINRKRANKGYDI